MSDTPNDLTGESTVTEAENQQVDAEIEVVSGDSSIQTVHVREILTIGRNSDNNLTLKDEVVSRNHALIRREGGDYIIVDLGSANGTFLNGQPVTNAIKIRSGDEIRMGGTILRFHRKQQQHKIRVNTTIDKKTAKFFAPVTLSIFVTDIRNYTTLSEKIPASELSSILADWFETAAQIITHRRGTIEQFRGDCVMAYWLSEPGADDNDYIVQAVDTARDLTREVHPVDERLSARYPELSFRIGCGVHKGEAVLGSIGPDSRRDLTMLGDSVNVAFRIEAMCSSLGREILVSEAVKDAVGESFEFEDLGLHGLKGKSEETRIYTLQ
jgi:class 3 adenylate cyclase